MVVTDSSHLVLFLLVWLLFSTPMFWEVLLASFIESLRGCVESVMNMRNLVSLKINSLCLDLFDSQFHFLEHIVSLKRLKSLSFCTCARGDSYSEARGTMHSRLISLSVEDLHVDFTHDDEYDDFSRIQVVNQELLALSRIFVGIRKLSIDDSEYFVYDWSTIFGELLRKKAVYAMENGSICPLESVELLSLQRQNAMAALKALHELSNEEYYGLKRISMTVKVWYEDDRALGVDRGYGSFLDESLVPFLKCARNKENIESIDFQYDCWRRCADNTYGPELAILRNLPRSLLFLDLGMRSPNTTISPGDTTPRELVSLLCGWLINTGENMILEISIKGIKLPLEETKYLTFMFGYSNQLTLIDDRAPQYQPKRALTDFRLLFKR